ncbi:hypothetical protein BC830DRAFT_1151234 [Chytriomyces sp. MP71]|nr:hypothetical protein BC830DRAFT_1151234 [Chytriomyces sp. MP71]
MQAASPTSSVIGTTTAVLPVSSIDHLVLYTSSNVLSNFFRGLTLGISLVTVLIALFLKPLFPLKTMLAAVIISSIQIFLPLWTSLYDVLGLQNCFLRVKVIYSFLFLSQITYNAFQADLTRQINAFYSKSFPGTIPIIFAILLTRVAVATFVVIESAYQEVNGICLSVLPPFITLIDKLSETFYSSVLAFLFIYPIARGYKDISVIRISQSISTAPTRVLSNGIGDRISEDMSWFKQIIVDRGFVLLLTMITELVNIICVYTTPNPSVTSLWNGLFACSNVVLMVVHMLGSVRRNSRRAASATVTKVTREATGSSFHSPHF